MDNRLFLGHDKLEVLAHHFKVVDTHGTMLFAVNKNEVLIGANALNVVGEGGAIFQESIQTPLIRAEPGKELKCVSNPNAIYIIVIIISENCHIDQMYCNFHNLFDIGSSRRQDRCF